MPPYLDPGQDPTLFLIRPKSQPTFTNGFEVLAEVLGDEIGQPLTDEQPGDDPDSVIQLTTKGLLHWSPGHPAAFFDGYRGAALRGDGASVTRWAGEGDLSPPNVPTAGAPAVANGVWDRLASCEASSNWRTNTGNGYFGGLQEDMTFWRRHGGLAYAPRPDLASREAQIAVAQRGQAAQGWGAWPRCSRIIGLR